MQGIKQARTQNPVYHLSKSFYARKVNGFQPLAILKKSGPFDRVLNTSLSS